MALFFFFVILQLDNFINPATLNLSLDKRFVETLPIRQTLIHRVDTPCQKEDSTVTKKLSASRAKTCNEMFDFPILFEVFDEYVF